MLDVNNIDSLLERGLGKRKRIGPDIKPNPVPVREESSAVDSIVNAGLQLGKAYQKRPVEAQASGEPLLHEAAHTNPAKSDNELFTSKGKHLWGGMPRFRFGGIYDKRQPFIVGEDGAEIVDPQSQTVIPNDAIEQILSGGNQTAQEKYGGMPTITEMPIDPGMTPPQSIQGVGAVPLGGGQVRTAPDVPALGMNPAIPQPNSPKPNPLEDILNGGLPPGSATSPIAHPSAEMPNVPMGKPPKFHRQDGQERLEDSPSRVMSIIGNALGGISQVASQNPNASIGEVLAGGIAPGVIGGFDPQSINRYRQAGNQQIQDANIIRRGKQAQVEGQEQENIYNQGRPAREAAKIAEQSGKAQEAERDQQISRLLTMHGRLGHYNPDDPNDRSSQQIKAEAERLGVDLVPYTEKDRVPQRQSVTIDGVTTIFERGDDGEWVPAKGLPQGVSGEVGREITTYQGKIADLDGKIAQAQTEVSNAQSHLDSLNANPVTADNSVAGDAAAASYRTRKQQMVDALDAANSKLRGLTTERKGLPKPKLLQQKEEVQKVNLSGLAPEQRDKAEKYRKMILELDDTPEEKARAMREWLETVRKWGAK